MSIISYPHQVVKRELILPQHSDFVRTRGIGSGNNLSPYVQHSYTIWDKIKGRLSRPLGKQLHPTYAGTRIDPVWLSYWSFRRWHDDRFLESWLGQEFCERSSHQIDKDLTFFSRLWRHKAADRYYGPAYCLFIPADLNSFLVFRNRTRGDLPLGVNWHKQKQRYKAQCRPCGCPLFTQYMSYYDDPVAAHRVYLKRKIQIAKWWLTQLDEYPEAKHCLQQFIYVLAYHIKHNLIFDPELTFLPGYEHHRAALDRHYRTPAPMAI